MKYKKEKCEACGKMVSKKEIYFRDEETFNIICIHCFPQMCEFCNLEHPKTSFKKCRDNLFKILKRAKKDQDKIFKIRNDLPTYLEKQRDKMSSLWISDEEYGWGVVKFNPDDSFVKYKKKLTT